MVSRIRKIMFVVFIFATISGCASNRIGDYGLTGTQVSLRPVFWEKNKTRIIVGVTPAVVDGHTYIQNKHFGLESVEETDSLDADLTDFVLLFDYSDILKVKSIFIEELNKRGMQASSLDDKSLESQYHQLLTNNANPASVHMFREQNNADYLLLFHITRCGVINERDFRLRSIVGVTAYLIDLHNGNIEWKYYQSRREVVVAGAWKQPPDYLNVTTAIREAITLTMKKLTESFFQ